MPETTLALIATLADIERRRWPEISAAIPAWHPRNEGEPDPPKADPPPENLVGEARRKQRDAEKRAEELQKRLDALEDRDRTELERAQRRVTELEEENGSLGKQVNDLTRGRWVRDAAARAEFINPDLAVKLANLDEIEDERAAARAVKAIAEDEATKHLVKAKVDAPPAEQLRQVLKDGKTPPADDKTPVEPDPGLGRLQAAYAATSSQT